NQESRLPPGSDFRRWVWITIAPFVTNGYGEQVSKWFNRTLLPKVLADRSGLAFHSFRHTVATQLKQHGVELAYAQAIMGHSSGSITYDRYAKEVEVDRLVNVMAGVYKETGLNG
ncbi:tyrosine-type recombinase/integrase, partial [Escherichia coli]